MSNDTLIKVEGVSKKFCRSLKKSLWYGVQDLGNEIRGKRYDGDGELRNDEFWAVRNFSVEIKRGECLGLIGRNGAGKTTLLRMLNGLIKPDSGCIEIKGRVGALIALGAGFNPILTGRENIYVYGSVLGMTKKAVEKKINEIIEFSEIGDFIDMPIQGYSSGMVVRLGFSVAAILIKPDVLFLDEVLAVGDVGFTVKCLNVVRNLSAQSAVVLVSHNMQHVGSFCNRVSLMRDGSAIITTDDVARGIDEYFALFENPVKVSGSNKATIRNCSLLVNEKAYAGIEPRLDHGDQLTVKLEVYSDLNIENYYIVVYVMDASMSPLLCIPLCGADGNHLVFMRPHVEVMIPIGNMDLVGGKYSLTVLVKNYISQEILVRAQGLLPFRVTSSDTNFGKVLRPVIPKIHYPDN